MRHAFGRAVLLAAIVCVGCGSSHGSFTEGDGGGSGSDGAAVGDSSKGGDSSGGSADSGSSSGGDSSTSMESGAPAWNGTFSGPLTCTVPGNYDTSNSASGACGTQRWDVKTGTDSAATGVSLLPTLFTLPNMNLITQPSTLPTARLAPTETTVYAMQDVSLTFARLEDDSDYHLVISDTAGHTMITEVPFPGCVKSGPWQCLISRARASVEAGIGVSNLQLDQGHNHNFTVSIVGVGFFDPEHGQFGVAPNNLELHPVLAICFGKGCDPTKT
jgi:hypothetical protein